MNTAPLATPPLPMPPGPVTGPAAWYGPDMARRTDWIHTFTSTELAELDAAIRAFEASGTPLIEITEANFTLPTLGARLKAILHELQDGRGFVLLRGFDVGRYTRAQAATAYMGVGAYLGRPRSQNAKGHVLGHVKDLGLDINDPNVRYYQTTRRLHYHTDSCDIVGLLCLKTAKEGGESFIVSSTTLFNEVLARRPDLAPALFVPYATDRRGEIPEGMQPWFDLPPLSWLDGKLSGIYARQYIDSAQKNFPELPRLTRWHLEALDLYDALANDPSVHLQMAFLPGDMQFVHNHQILHSRNDFVNWPEPERHRHLLRLWLCPKEARRLPEAWAQRYGSVTPGDRGGIVVRGMQLKVPLEAE